MRLTCGIHLYMSCLDWFNHDSPGPQRLGDVQTARSQPPDRSTDSGEYGAIGLDHVRDSYVITTHTITYHPWPHVTMAAVEIRQRIDSSHQHMVDHDQSGLPIWDWTHILVYVSYVCMCGLVIYVDFHKV